MCAPAPPRPCVCVFLMHHTLSRWKSTVRLGWLFFLVTTTILVHQSVTSTAGTGSVIPLETSSSICAFTSASQCFGPDAGVWKACEAASGTRWMWWGWAIITGRGNLAVKIFDEKCWSSHPSSPARFFSTGGRVLRQAWAAPGNHRSLECCPCIPLPTWTGCVVGSPQVSSSA